MARTYIVLWVTAVVLASCSKPTTVTPLLTEKAGYDLGFQTGLQQSTASATVIARCIDDFQLTEGKRLGLSKIVQSGNVKFLIFQILYVDDAPAVVYVIEDNVAKFKFYHVLPGTGA
jgi:hypothetical protein